MKQDQSKLPAIIRGKDYDLPSAFTPENLLREARRQKRLAVVPVPDICVLDPDGDIVRYSSRPAAQTVIPNGPAITPISMSSSRTVVGAGSSAAP